MNAQTQKITINGKKIIVVRDDLLTGGTKEAALLSFIATIPSRELVYAGPRQGYAQIALAAACKAIGKKATLFIAQSVTKHPRSLKAHSLGAELREVPCGYLTVVQARAREYCKETGAQMLPFGLACEEMEAAIEARAWRFIEERATDGALFWNVAS